MRIIICSVLVLIGANVAFAQRCNSVTGSCFRQNQVQLVRDVYAQPVQLVEHVVPQAAIVPQTTIVNNLIGIPVPIQYNQPLSAQGTTVYGYSSVSEAHGNVDLGLLYNQAARLTEQAQQLAGQAHTDFSSLVQIEGNNRAEVAKIIAQGQAAREALSAVRTESSTQSQQLRTFSFKVSSTQNGEIQVQKMEPDERKFDTSSATNVSDLLSDKCVSCHNAGNAQGGLNLLDSISADQQESILSRVVTDDLTKRMPRNADGSVSPRLSVGELKVLFNSMGE
jgi:hypothetical protein